MRGNWGIPVLLFFNAISFSVYAEDPGTIFSHSLPNFSVTSKSKMDSDGKTFVEVTVRVPFGELSAPKSGNGYLVRERVAIAVLKNSHEQVAGDAFEKSTWFPDYNLVKSRNAGFETTKLFEVPSGKYIVNVTVDDVQSEESSEARQQVIIEGFGKGTVGITDLEFGLCEQKTVGEIGVFHRNMTNRFSDRLEKFCVHTQIVEKNANPQQSYKLHFEIEDDSSELYSKGDIDVPSDTIPSFFLTPDITSLFVGSYKMKIETVQGKRKIRREGRFEVDGMVIPQGKTWDQMMEILTSISIQENDEYRSTFGVNEQEVQTLKNSKDATARKANWEAFWRVRDTDPDTLRNEPLIEFAQRIQYAKSHFKEEGPGWRSDRGRIYIEYGPPDHIQNSEISAASKQQAERYGRPTIETWEYEQLKLRFIFEDLDHFGNYRLTTERSR